MRLGEMLIERRLISAEELDRALEIQKERGEKIGKILVDLGFVAMRVIAAVETIAPKVTLPNHTLGRCK